MVQTRMYHFALSWQVGRIPDVYQVHGFGVTEVYTRYIPGMPVYLLIAFQICFVQLNHLPTCLGHLFEFQQCLFNTLRPSPQPPPVV